MGLGGGDVLTGSDFALGRETGHGGILSFWSRGAQSRFSGREGALSLGGDVRTTMFGADYAKGPVVTGLSLSHSRGLGEYAGVAGGQVASSVTGLYPWLGYKATDRVTVWGVAGYGAGGLLLTPQGGPALESGLSMAMAAAGTRGELVAGGAGGFALAFKADALWVGTSIDGVDGPAGRLKATEAAVTRFRTGLEGSRAYTFAGRLSLKPSVEVGLRHDGGDAETGAGMDVGLGLVVSDSSTGLAVDVRVRTLLVHQAEGFSERGVGKLRRAMVRPGRDRVSEEVEVDETLVGGLEAGGGRRHLGKKALVVIAAEVRGRAIGRIRMQRVADASADSLLSFVQHAVHPGSVVITDGLQSYRRLPKLGYRHDRRVLLGRGESAEAVLPRVHRVASLLKRWLLGTHQGGVSREHLDYYLDEFTFRFNRRTSRHRGKLFHRLLEQAVAVGPVPYAAMVKGIRGRKKKRHHNR